MRFPQERIAEVCRWTPDEALAALERGRAGDLPELAAWVVHSAYRAFLRGGAAPAAAEHRTRGIMEHIELKPSLIP